MNSKYRQFGSRRCVVPIERPGSGAQGFGSKNIIVCAYETEVAIAVSFQRFPKSIMRTDEDLDCIYHRIRGVEIGDG